jgi:lycopene beta-cyclase
MAHFHPMRWDDGYEVRFPGRARHLATPYYSLASADFAAGLARMLPQGTIVANTPAARLDVRGVTLAGGERIDARAVIDCRGFAPTRHLSGGWQVFLGGNLRTEKPHGVKRPLLMDATVGQTRAGLRFVYVLPLGERELFVEDTYYQDRPVLDRDALTRRLQRYSGRRGWAGTLTDVETGVLPVVTGGDFAAWQAEQRIDGVARAGAHAGFIHPLTGYTLPFAVATALAIADAPDVAGPALAAMLEARAAAHWRQTRFYRRLGTVLFGAAPPSRRWKVFARFYRLPGPLIERFYAAQSTRADRWRILCGRPPVSPLRALHALATTRPVLREAA